MANRRAAPAPAPKPDDGRNAPIIRKFLDFLEQDFGKGPALDQVQLMMERRERRLVVNFNDLHESDRDLGQKVLTAPAEYVEAFDSALEEAVNNINPEYGKEWHNRFHVGFEGSFGQNSVTPRTLTAKYLNQLIALDGIVTKASLVRPRVLKSVHFCEKTKLFSEREYRDGASLTGLPSTTVYPTRDDAGNLLTTEYGLCEYENIQHIHVQEMPENAEVGALPRSVDVIVCDDLVDKCKPGDRVQVVGVYITSPQRFVSSTNGMFRTSVIAIALKSLGKEILQPIMSDTDIQNIHAIGLQKDVLKLLAKSLAPSIHGHEFIKKGILCVLLGGMEKNLANGTHLRGDINLLMVGDPSTAKSQLLRFVMQIAPLAISTSGRGSSGVGLTAAVTTDSETNERKLEAGAMVLADRGVVCIDEFDKMSDSDRVAIHEVMEQQTVTISKADIHTSLNARCSVVAAANPVYGSYDRNRKASINIGLPDSLLSRFDLLFLVLDSHSQDVDRHVASHVLRNHRFRPASEQGASLEFSDTSSTALFRKREEGDTIVWEKYNRLLHGDLASGSSPGILSIKFLKKFIHYARTRVRPQLSEDAREAIHLAYADLRAGGAKDGMTLPITPRSLETIIRLSTAHAKARLSNVISKEDVLQAVALLKFALSGEDERNAPIEEEQGDEYDSDGNSLHRDDSSSDDDNDNDNDGGKRRSRRLQRKQTRSSSKSTARDAATTSSRESRVREREKRQKTKKGSEMEIEQEEQDEDEEMEDASSPASAVKEPPKLSAAAIEDISQRISAAFTSEQIELPQLVAFAREGTNYTDDDVLHVAEILHDKNRIFIAGKQVLRI